MAKTYNSIPTVSTGDVYTATAHNNIVTNVNNYRVPPMCRVKRSGDQTGYSSNTAIAWNAEDYDTDDMHDNSTNNSRITIQTAGVYLFTAGVYASFSGTLTAWNMLVRRTRSGSPLVAIEQDFYGSRAGDFVSAASGTIECAVGDFFEVNVVMTGSTSNIIKDALQTFFTATWLGQVS